MLPVHTHSVTRDYRISRQVEFMFSQMDGDKDINYCVINMQNETNSFQVLGVGINGKVVECESRQTGEKFALKVPICFMHFIEWAL